MSSHEPSRARVTPLRLGASTAPMSREPLWRDIVGGVLRGERLAQGRTLKDVADEARVSMPYLSEIERGLKEASSEVLAAVARALGLRLADLLVRAHIELSNLTQVTSSFAVRSAAGYGDVRADLRRRELCLAV